MSFHYTIARRDAAAKVRIRDMCTSLMMGEEDMYRSGLRRLLVAAEDRRLALDAHEDREDRRRDDDVAHAGSVERASRRCQMACNASQIRGVTIFEARPIHVPERSRPFITTTGTGRPGLSKPQRIARGRRGREAAQSLTPQAPWQKSSQRRRPSRVENRRSATVKLETRAPDNGSHLKNCAFSRKSTTPHAASTSARRASAL